VSVSNPYAVQAHIPLEINSPLIAALEAGEGVAACFCASARRGCQGRPQSANRGSKEMDIVMIGMGVGFLAISFAYVKACDSL